VVDGLDSGDRAGHGGAGILAFRPWQMQLCVYCLASTEVRTMVLRFLLGVWSRESSAKHLAVAQYKTERVSSFRECSRAESVNDPTQERLAIMTSFGRLPRNV
jgi:hypothetical protein